MMSPGSALPDLPHLSRAAVRACLAVLAEQKRLDGLALVDGTCGNGHDTLFLAGLLAELPGLAGCRVYTFDVQQAALDAARALARDGLGPEQAERIAFVFAGHERLRQELLARAPTAEDGPQPLIAAGMYNLGYLPGSDKSVITRRESTLASLEAVASALVPGGLLSVHAYGGHPGGAEEMDAVGHWCCGLPFGGWRVARYSQCNRSRNQETLFLAEKREPA